jgi:hypothetical protein
MSPRLFDRPPADFTHQLDRLDRETAARLRDHGTAQTFQLRGTPPATYDAAPLFEYHAPDHGPEPLPGQTSLL